MSPDPLLMELKRERSIRRAVKVLETKRNGIKEELQQLIKHIALLVPTANESNSELLQEAVKRLEDDGFAQLLLQIIQELQ